MEEICNIKTLVDIWRIRNPEVTYYSWMKALNHGKKMLASRIDFALVSQGISGDILNCMYLGGIHTDHAALFLAVELSNSDRGPGFWKFNNMYLMNPEFIDGMNKQIDSQIAMTINMEKIERWEVVRKEMVNFAKKYAKDQASNRDLIISQLSEQITELQKEVSEHEECDEKWDLLQRTKADLDDKMTMKMKGVIFRTKCKWYEMGEINSKYFYNLEKTRYNARVCKKMIT